MKKLLPVIFLLTALSAGTVAQTPQTAASNVVAAAGDARTESFNIVWQTVKEKHFDPTFGGVDWDKVREKYAPRVAAVKSDDELYQLLQQMLGELHQSHFAIIPPEAVTPAEIRESAEGGIGIDLRVVEGQAVITRVEPGSKAAAAGLRTGFAIRQVDQTPVEQIIQRFAKRNMSPALTNLYIARSVLGRIEGKPGTTVRISYLDARDQTREASIEREPFRGEVSPPMGNFPPQYMEFETKRVASGIGYIRFNIFVVPMMGKIKTAIRQMNNAPGIIIDLRGNPGGVGSMAPGIAGVLVSKQTSLGVMSMRVGHSNFAVFPQEGEIYTGPVAILIDGSSASTSEVFAGGMQDIGRAVVVGERSAGAALPSIFAKLPTGALFQYAIADFKTPKGVLIEGRGVIPDKEVKLTRRTLLEGRDTQLEAAIEQITKK